MKLKAVFFEKINKNDKALSRLINKKREMAQIKYEQTNHKDWNGISNFKTPNKKIIQDHMASQVNYIKHLEKS